MVEVRVATVGVEVGRGMVGLAIVVVTVGGIVVVVGTVTMGTVVVIRVVVAVVGTVRMTGASRIRLEVAWMGDTRVVRLRGGEAMVARECTGVTNRRSDSPGVSLMACWG
jgi:hypothetical protein